MVKLSNPDGPVTRRDCDGKHRSNVRLNIATISMLGIIIAGGSTVFSVFMSQQSNVAEAAAEAMQVVRMETGKAKGAREHIKEDVNEIKQDVKEFSQKQDNMNVSLRLLIQKVDENGK